MATTRVAAAPMKAAQVPKGGADFQMVEREIPKPGAGHVRIKVQACGVCHSDVFTKEGQWPGPSASSVAHRAGAERESPTSRACGKLARCRALQNYGGTARIRS